MRLAIDDAGWLRTFVVGEGDSKKCADVPGLLRQYTRAMGADVFGDCMLERRGGMRSLETRGNGHLDSFFFSS